jgi:hypothetical protein
MPPGPSAQAKMGNINPWVNVECPKISTRPHMHRKPRSRASPQGWTSPRVLRLENHPQALKTLTTLLVQKVFRLPHLTPAWAMTLLINSPGQNLLSILKYPHRVLSLLDSELLVDVNPVKLSGSRSRRCTPA